MTDPLADSPVALKHAGRVQGTLLQDERVLFAADASISTLMPDGLLFGAVIATSARLIALEEKVLGRATLHVMSYAQLDESGYGADAISECVRVTAKHAKVRGQVPHLRWSVRIYQGTARRGPTDTKRMRLLALIIADAMADNAAADADAGQREQLEAAQEYERLKQMRDNPDQRQP